MNYLYYELSLFWIRCKMINPIFIRRSSTGVVLTIWLGSSSHYPVYLISSVVKSSVTVSPTAVSLVSDQHSLIRSSKQQPLIHSTLYTLTHSSPTAAPVIALRRRHAHRPLLPSPNDRWLTYLQQLRPWSLCVAVFTILRLTRSRTAVKRLVITVQRFFSDASTCLKHSTGCRLARKWRNPDDAHPSVSQARGLKGPQSPPFS